MTDHRPGPLYSAFFGRLRARPLSSWSVGERSTVAHRACAELAALGWAAENRGEAPVPTVPDLGPHALADQLQVLLDDALAAGADPAAVHALMAELATRLSVRFD
ncbi:hypothetical protein [Nakamurella deserti]|uniref:hypothetical protein n=1 Tax=Nakamurella deserti TaxID=2164074 RepID=UPI000DBE0530|nr:hypothetical protein [Nakamurella deserti]